jgi:hypothetical protein
VGNLHRRVAGLILAINVLTTLKKLNYPLNISIAACYPDVLFRSGGCKFHGRFVTLPKQHQKYGVVSEMSNNSLASLFVLVLGIILQVACQDSEDEFNKERQEDILQISSNLEPDISTNQEMNPELYKSLTVFEKLQFQLNRSGDIGGRLR